MANVRKCGYFKPVKKIANPIRWNYRKGRPYGKKKNAG